ncbi:MAG: GIY-YIG nuclease family protein [Gammaproteobacteria bacterium]|nr:GIY-YIG nuclease family protein [Gammaproteobacteria bacterium]NNF49369.1 GIY-YIG nuclease family protein [Woeseiaceae bacterium]MBT8093558.1 GIY-YIG nuclease family protein [Gammaproteobacteria bacterium]MBT8106478.1 GIY-YIG nuclease family protein [Gammaproteobacteria bacterium]NNK26493.1 GIY-YIG nuclease family protein [Woeseiaceae bacterium]
MPDAARTRPEYSLYIVRCADGSLYTGIATDVDRRFDEHVSGVRGARFLRGKGPLEIVFCARAGDRAAASRLEYRVKRLNRAQKLALVAGRFRLTDLVDDQVVEDGGT